MTDVPNASGGCKATAPRRCRRRRRPHLSRPLPFATPAACSGRRRPLPTQTQCRSLRRHPMPVCPSTSHAYACILESIGQRRGECTSALPAPQVRPPLPGRPPLSLAASGCLRAARWQSIDRKGRLSSSSKFIQFTAGWPVALSAAMLAPSQSHRCSLRRRKDFVVSRKVDLLLQAPAGHIILHQLLHIPHEGVLRLPPQHALGLVGRREEVHSPAGRRRCGAAAAAVRRLPPTPASPAALRYASAHRLHPPTHRKGKPSPLPSFMAAGS